jgi:hypothetical protein
MKRTTKYVALDVHQATTVSSVRDDRGRIIARSIMPTDGQALLAFFSNMRGAVHVAFGEGTQAHWLSELLTPVVQHVVVGNRRGESAVGQKNDRHDADVLSDLLHHGQLRAVYHGQGDHARLKELTRMYAIPAPGFKARDAMTQSTISRAQDQGAGHECLSAATPRVMTRAAQ